MEESQKHYTKQKKPDPRVYSVLVHSYETLGKTNLISGYKKEIMVVWN